MKNFSLAILATGILVLGAGDVLAQVKGIDTQNQQIKDVGTRPSASDSSGSTRNIGPNRGIDWGGDKSPDRLQIANPYRLNSKRDILLTTLADVLRERNLVVDDAASRLNDGVLVTQPFTFAKGAVLSQSELQRFAIFPDDENSAWTRGRYTLTIEVQSIDGIANNVSVTAKVEGRSETGLGGQWVTLPSSGTAENDLLEKLIERVTGTSPYEMPKPAEKTNDKPEKP